MTVMDADAMINLNRTETFEIDEFDVASPDDLHAILGVLAAKYEESYNRGTVYGASINVQLTVMSGKAYY